MEVRHEDHPVMTGTEGPGAPEVVGSSRGYGFVPGCVESGRALVGAFNVQELRGHRGAVGGGGAPGGQ